MHLNVSYITNINWLVVIIVLICKPSFSWQLDLRQYGLKHLPDELNRGKLDKVCIAVTINPSTFLQYFSILMVVIKSIFASEAKSQVI